MANCKGVSAHAAARIGLALAASLAAPFAAAAAAAAAPKPAAAPVAAPAAAPVAGAAAADACPPGVAGAIVTVHGFKDRRGRLRVQSYRGNPQEFLASGRYLRRAEVPVAADGEMTLCLPLPGPGTYAIVALHDRDSNGKLSVWSDGVGFSRNPRLGLAKPAVEATSINVGNDVAALRIVLNYRRGLSVRPLG